MQGWLAAILHELMKSSTESARDDTLGQASGAGEKGVAMKRMSALSVCLAGLLQAGLSLGADCATLPSDSISRLECQRSQTRLEAPKGLPTQLVGRPGSQQGGGGRSHPWAQEAPPFRTQGADPLITVFLVSGSTIRVDKTWVRGDRLFYFTRGVRGSVPLTDVNRLEDLRTKIRAGHGE